MLTLGKRHGLSICTVFVFFAVGCVSAAPPSTLATANLGPPPVEYDATIRAMIDPMLRDPYSAVYTFQRPVRSWFFSESQQSWAVCGTVNAKNAYGGYVGARPFTVYFRHGRVVDSAFGNINDPRAQSDVASLCAKWHAAGLYE